MNIPHSDKDFHTSVEKALEEIDPKYASYPGLVIIGSHAPEKIEEKLALIKDAREKGIPFLGICLGFQLMAIEWVRTMAGLADANTTEVDPNTPTPVIVKMKKRHTGIRPVTWFDGIVTNESHWHNYALNPFHLRYFPQELWDVSIGEHAVEMLRYKAHPFFWGVQFHPEYESSADNPHPLLQNFIDACKQQVLKSI